MTAYELVRLARRRWILLVAGVLATIAFGYTAQPETVYWATMELKVTAPADPVAPKTLEDPEVDPIVASTMLITLVNGGHIQPKSTSPETTLYGEGKRQAMSARLRDTGGQWGTQVRDAIIDVQAVDYSPSVVLERLEKQQAELTQLLNKLQDDLEVAPSQRIAVVPSTRPEVLLITGSRIRATVSSLLIGLGLTLTLIYWIEMSTSRRAHNPLPEPSEPGQRSRWRRRPEPARS